ncbi:MAG: sulfur carrier protein ThiS [Leptospiraceae bacterium]|nr:sulfur carrier protein ThiS [Leptospiraceae bacterium]
MTVNGQNFDFALLQKEPVLTSLVQQLGLNPERVAIELNGELINRSQYATTTVSDRDAIEIIHYVGGG